jgi:hypothetical protein
MNRSTILLVVSFILHLAFQLVFLKNAVLFHSAFCFIYIAFLLLLPVETSAVFLMMIGFGTGIFIDMFYDSLGLHALACVAIMYMRNLWLTRLTPQGGYDSGVFPNIATNGLQWFLTYSIPLIFIHHAILFFTEVGGFQYFGFTLLKVIFSTLFTTIVILVSQYLFPGARRI